ncbi:MAG: HAMP domain-containing sensor histidine kinase, partial [Bacteroidales bacterium]
QGTWQATGRWMSGRFEILNARGDSFVMLDRYTRQVFTAGRGAQDNLYLNYLSLQTGSAIEVKPVEVRLRMLKKIEADNPVSLPKEKIVIIDYKNEVIYSTDEDYTLKINKELLDNIRLKGEVRFSQEEFEVFGFLFADRYDRFVVIAAGVDIFGLRKLVNLRNILLAVVSASILLLMVSGWIYAGRALSPILRVITKVDEISAASMNLRLDEGNQKDEISRLAGTFNKMLDRLETAFKSQKHFITNASHELRTPLTAISGQLEVVMLQERSSEEYRKVIISVLEDMRNLNNISNRLLLLAQASAELAELNIRPLRIDEIVWQCRDELIRRHENYRIHVNLDENIDDEAKLLITGDELLIKTLVINLIDNGCKYSENRTVVVTISAENNTSVVSFADQGIGIPGEDLLHIFEPFRRGQNARHIEGHGIGLSLVDRIAFLHQGKVEVTSQLNVGTTFTIYLPQLS